MMNEDYYHYGHYFSTPFPIWSSAQQPAIIDHPQSSVSVVQAECHMLINQDHFSAQMKQPTNKELIRHLLRVEFFSKADSSKGSAVLGAVSWLSKVLQYAMYINISLIQDREVRDHSCLISQLLIGLSSTRDIFFLVNYCKLKWKTFN